MAQILVISGHPDTNSFNHALAQAYYDGAIAAGHTAEILELGALTFDPILHHAYKDVQQLEPDLLKAQQMIKGASHLVIVYPSWWGATPALLKGFFDRTFHPGFAFKYRQGSPFWDKLLAGKSARIIVTMDSPVWWDMFVYHRSGINAVKIATLQYCGIKPVRVTVFDRVRFSTPEKRLAWLKKVTEFGKNKQ